MKTKMRYRLLYVAPIVLLLSVLFLNLKADVASAVIPEQGGSTANEGAWDDHNDITYDGQTYFDDKTDGTLNFASTSQICVDPHSSNLKELTSGEPATITVKSSSDITDATLVGPTSSTDKECASTQINLTEIQNEDIYFKWSDDSTIVTTDGRRTYPLNGSSYIETKDDVDNGSGCHDSISVDSPDATSATLVMRGSSATNANASSYPSDQVNSSLWSESSGPISGCYETTATVQIIPQSSSIDDTGQTITQLSQHSDNVTCDTGGFGLNWILCPIFNSLAGLSGWLFSNVVQPFLRTTPISTDPSDPSFQIWSSFRIYGDIFLVIALLVVVFGQSIGGGLIDAYTAKKVLPRLLAAAILINLSIYIVAAMVDLTNILGGGIGELMTAPLKNAGAFNISPSGVAGGKILGLTGAGIISGLGAGVFALLTKVSAITNFAGFVGLFIIMPVVFGLIAAFITLVVRKAIILALVLVSPVAFALYCLPNTEKYFRKWWEFLLRSLAVYPIVIIFFAVADILSVTIEQANGSSSALAGIISFLLQFLPLLFIPYAFRLAGGAIGSLHELLTTNHKKMQEGIKGNPNDPFSLRNKAKHGVLSELTDAQRRNVLRGRELHAGRRAKIMSGITRGSGFSGNIDDRHARYTADARKRREQVSNNTDDSILFASAGWVLKAGEQAPSELAELTTDAQGNKIPFRNTTTNYDRYVNAKGEEISESLYKQGKRWYGSNQEEIVQSLTYAEEKAVTDNNAANVQIAFAKNAEEGKWHELGTLEGNYEGVTYPNKSQFAFLRYNAPVYDEKTKKVSFVDVRKDDKARFKLIKDMHKTRQGHILNIARDQDWENLHGIQQDLEAKALNNKITGPELRDLGMTYEIFNGVSQELRMVNPNAVTGTGGDITATGATPASKAIIEDAVRSRQFDISTVNTTTKEKQLSAKNGSISHRGIFTTGKGIE